MARRRIPGVMTVRQRIALGKRRRRMTQAGLAYEFRVRRNKQRRRRREIIARRRRQAQEERDLFEEE